MKKIIYAIVLSTSNYTSGYYVWVGSSPIQFKDESYQSGVASEGVNSSGPTFIDYDNDGDIDIYVVTEYHGEGQGNRLFENQGDRMFVDVAELRGVDNDNALGRGASWGDYDNDGDMDLAISNLPPTDKSTHIPTTLYKNLLKETGEPNFQNVTREAQLFRKGNEDDRKIGGIGNTGAGIAWADYDNDGDLDLYWKCADFDIENALFRNNGDGTFTDVTEETGTGVLEFVLEANSQGAPSWTDVNHDGYVDLLVTNEGDKKILFLNDQEGSFRNITTSFRPPSGVVFLNPGNANGACIGDIDNDGDMDVFLSTSDQANRLYISLLKDTGQLNYKDITLTSGVSHKSGARGCAMGDFDNDGLIDIYVNNGGLADTLINDVIDIPIFVQFYIAIEPDVNKLFRNNGDLTFSDLTWRSRASGYGVGSGVGTADLDEDGFLDIFFTNRTFYTGGEQITESDRNYLLFNRGNRNSWLTVNLVGQESNTNGYGARVTLVADDLTQYREATSAHGYNSGNDPRMHFGLGNKSSIDFIEVLWPSGKKSKVMNPSINQTVTIEE
ncbi:MAG TPA: CRTAC1 family protein [Gammaproteobacteria bacterium]|nr:CRTAC1 family protein [Gammaproteobacteria bacterium]